MKPIIGVLAEIDNELITRVQNPYIHAIEGSGRQYIRAYQWHPERLFEADTQNRIIFEDFIRACKS